MTTIQPIYSDFTATRHLYRHIQPTFTLTGNNSFLASTRQGHTISVNVARAAFYIATISEWDTDGMTLRSAATLSAADEEQMQGMVAGHLGRILTNLNHTHAGVTV